MSHRDGIIDHSRFPLVVFKLPRIVDMDTVEALAIEQAKVFERSRKFVSIVDLRNVSAMPTATVRKRIGEWAKSIEEPSKRYQLANVILVDSSLVRAGLAAVHWIAPPPVPTKVTLSEAEGIAFLRGHLETAGIPSAFAGL